MANKKPNIIIFNPDQWRWDVMGHMGNPAAVTPNLDALVETEAVSFSQAFCQNTVCTPSRCSFMTGWYPHVRGHRTMHHMLHPEWNEPNLLKILKKEGYFVWWGGKNDLSPGQDPVDDYCDIKFSPTKEDFERWGYQPQEGNHGGDMAWRGEPEGDNFFSFYKGKLDKGDKDLYCDGDWMMILGALDFIKSYKGDKPYVIYLPITYPHPPYCVEEPWYSITDRSKIPDTFKFFEEGKPSLLKGIREGQNLQDWTDERWRELRGTYYGMCSRLDHQFGRLTDALKEAGVYDDSAIFLFSDHGDFTGDYGIVEKTQNTFEDVLSRVPFIIKPPKGTPVKPGVNEALVELVDFSATVYEMTGIDPGYDSFGKNLLPLISGEAESVRDAAFCEGGRRLGEKQASEIESFMRKGIGDEKGLYSPRVRLQIQFDEPYHTKAAMCRTSTHKYTKRLYESDELYDLIKDPGEEHNVINDPAYKEVLLTLKERLADWYMETADVVPRITDQR
jgi:arylsulfatase A-like enzyme